MTGKKKLAAILSTMIFVSSMAPAFAADIDTEIKEQQRILFELQEQKNSADSKEIRARMDKIEAAINTLRQEKKYDTEGAIDSLAAQLEALRRDVDAQSLLYEKMFKTLDILEKKLSGNDGSAKYNPVTVDEVPNTRKYLVNPGPREAVSYTQDAVNAQGNSTMLFAYAPNQLYKIYCRQGYLTDIELKAGEKVNFVGGGDTSGWSVIANDVGGVPHVYIKPIVDNSVTNIIITTNKRSYQLIANTSDWYNPIVKWTYNEEVQQEAVIKQQKEEQLITGTINSNPQNLDFAYEIKQKNTELAPLAIFSDGVQTFIKFDKSMKKAPIVFIKGNGKKKGALVNYRIKDNTMIVDSIFDEAELRISDTEYITIKHKKP